MRRILRVFAVVMMLVCTAVVAQADNNPSVTGRVEAQSGAFTWEVNVTAVQQGSGRIVGRLKLERLFNGQPNWSVDAAVDQLVIAGNRAYGTAGNYVFAIEDNGEGGNADADRFLVINFLSGAPELTPVILASPLFTSLWGFFSVPVSQGNVQVRD